MNPEQWEKVSGALDQFLALAQTEREQFLAQLRSDDPQLCAEVESLAKQQDSTNLFDSPPAGLLTFVQSTPVMFGDNPEKAGRFELRGEIARGGMGAVLRAFDPDIQRVLAVKMLLPATRGDKDTEWCFLREAQITGRLQHPGIPPIHELGRLDDGSPFFAMKLIEGQTLATILAQPTPLGVARLVGIFEQICRTLAYAHGQQIIHRDLKPSNVMVGAFGEVQVMDWGLAKELRQNEQPTQNGAKAIAPPEVSQAGNVSGTPAYMAPEQARGETEQLDERCDVFGLGGILCAMLTGRPPFVGDTIEMIRASAAGDLGPIFARLDTCSADAELIAIARKCLAPGAHRRYRNAGEVADAITRFREGVQEKLKQTELERERAEVKVVEERRRRRVLAVLAAFVIATIIGAGGAGVWYQHENAKIEHERALRAAETAAQKKYLEQEINVALDRAEHLGKQLNGKLADPNQVASLLSNLDDWQKHLDGSAAALERAAALAGSSKVPFDADLVNRLDRLTKQLTADREDFRLAVELDEVRVQGNQLLPAELASVHTNASREYTRIFTAKGIDLINGKPHANAQVIKEMRLRFVLVSAIDQWAIAMIKKKDQTPQDNLMLTARLTDPDPWRDQVRDPKNWRKGRLTELAQKADLAQLSPQFLGMVGELMFFFDGAPVLPFMRKALARYPSDYWLQFNTGWMVYSSQNPDHPAPDAAREMQACFQAALAIRPNSNTNYFHLAWVLEKTGNPAGAAAYYDRAIVLNPKDAWSRLNLGRILSARGDRKSAISNLRKAIEIDPKYALAHSNLGGYLVDSGDFDAAIPYLEKAIELKPDQASAHNNLGVALREKKAYDRAALCFKKAIELDKNNAAAHNNLGALLGFRGDSDAALASYQRAVELAPRMWQTHVNIGMILQKNGRIAEAYQAYQKGHAIGGKLPHCPAWVGERVKELERPANLDAKLSGVLANTIKPRDPNELIELALLCRNYKKTSAPAVELYKRAFALDAKLAAQHRVAAVSAALLAASEQAGKGAPTSEAERAALRSQALVWLKLQLETLAKAKNDQARKELQRWRTDPNFGDVRGPQALAKMPESERMAWEQFWAQLDKALQVTNAP